MPSGRTLTSVDANNTGRSTQGLSTTAYPRRTILRRHIQEGKWHVLHHHRRPEEPKQGFHLDCSWTQANHGTRSGAPDSKAEAVSTSSRPAAASTPHNVVSHLSSDPDRPLLPGPQLLAEGSRPRRGSASRGGGKLLRRRKWPSKSGRWQLHRHSPGQVHAQGGRPRRRRASAQIWPLGHARHGPGHIRARAGQPRPSVQGRPGTATRRRVQARGPT